MTITTVKLRRKCQNGRDLNEEMGVAKKSLSCTYMYTSPTTFKIVSTVRSWFVNVSRNTAYKLQVTEQQQLEYTL
jgi:hypothetical protein